eukprot:TRINITY_DN2795_c0_g1_i5.p1 TRINITY_DN2795_c0_g1~~TRINITY_DN2795_c0_g1_i5.p1  ORF type:complete len:287 (+),score=34.63 TRINITY_DN2795_c0_g1_i5:1-861(+)
MYSVPRKVFKFLQTSFSITYTRTTVQNQTSKQKRIQNQKYNTILIQQHQNSQITKHPVTAKMDDLTNISTEMCLEQENNIMFRENITVKCFQLLSVIGRGTFAKVVLVKRRDDHQLYAMKVVKKDRLKAVKQRLQIQNERNILVNVNHPFIVRMHYAFQNERKLFFVLEYCPGGELFNLLQRQRCFREDVARFYAIQILLALEHLHQIGIVYRDLKPENILIDRDGYVRLTDFGLSKPGIRDNKGANSVCGTPEYLAPEILFRMGHGRAVDWWTFGALLYLSLIHI